MADKARTNTLGLNVEEMKELIREVSESGLDSFEYKEGDFSISLHTKNQALVKNASVTAATGAGISVPDLSLAMAEAAEAASGAEDEDDSFVIKSPLVGTFYSAPAAGAAPFVKVGDRVKKGQVLGIVEAMKMMNEIESDCDGTIAEICVANESAVEFGQPLFKIN